MHVEDVWFKTLEYEKLRSPLNVLQNCYMVSVFLYFTHIIIERHWCPSCLLLFFCAIACATEIQQLYFQFRLRSKGHVCNTDKHLFIALWNRVSISLFAPHITKTFYKSLLYLKNCKKLTENQIKMLFIVGNCPRLKFKQAFTANYYAFTGLCWKSLS